MTVADGVVEGARTRGFASLTLVRFAFVSAQLELVRSDLKSWQSRIDSRIAERIMYPSNVWLFQPTRTSPKRLVDAPYMGPVQRAW